MTRTSLQNEQGLMRKLHMFIFSEGRIYLWINMQCKFVQLYEENTL